MLSTLTKVDESAIEQINEEKRIRKTNELFLLFSMGSQYDHLIKQCMEKAGVSCLVADPKRITKNDVKIVNPIGIIVSGGPASVFSELPTFDRAIFDLEIPVLGICLGLQMWAKHIGIPVLPAGKREFGIHKLTNLKPSLLFDGCSHEMNVVESHGDRVEPEEWLPTKLMVLGSTTNSPVAAAQYKHLYGVQFHPEVSHTEFGQQIFENFIFKICAARDRFPAENVAEQKIATIRKQIGNRKKILLALSGGSDSSTVAYLLKKALTDKNGKIQNGRVRAVYIKGVDRPDDEAHVLEYFGNEDWLEFIVIDATRLFLAALKGIKGWEEKRAAMKSVYESVLNEQAVLFGAHLIAQGTLYTDVSESGQGYDIGARKAKIKSHHNVGLNFCCEELTPLIDCVKDTGRNIGRAIGVPEILLTRHPFPGPGLILRIDGEVTEEKLAVARQLDGIWIEELRKWNLYDTVWQAGVLLTDTKVTCTKGDDAVMGYMAIRWAEWSVNGFTSQTADLPREFLQHTSRRMTDEIREVGTTSYRDGDKPPRTIEMG